MKHQLLIAKFQTPIQAHFDLWLGILQLVEWLLFLASDELTPQPKKWQKSADSPKSHVLKAAIPESADSRRALTPPDIAAIPAEILETTLPTEIPHEDPIREAQWVKPPPIETERPRLSLPQARKAAQTLFLTFDQTNLLPQTSQKGTGRKFGTRFTPKPIFKPIKKTPKRKKMEALKGNPAPNLRKKQLNSS